jgi:hypothetical protein
MYLCRFAVKATRATIALRDARREMMPFELDPHKIGPAMSRRADLAD